MTSWSHGLSESPQSIEKMFNISDSGKQSLIQLRQKGFVILCGLSPTDIPTLRSIAQQPSIMRYCPRDFSERFSNTSTAIAWLSKGRSFFALRDQTNNRIAGYGWSGPGSTEYAPKASITVALRISERYQGQGLASLFFTVIVDAIRVAFPNESIWLETWQSNAGAVHIYEKNGFSIIKSLPSMRPQSSGADASDTRLFMMQK